MNTRVGIGSPLSPKSLNPTDPACTSTSSLHRQSLIYPSPCICGVRMAPKVSPVAHAARRAKRVIASPTPPGSAEASDIGVDELESEEEAGSGRTQSSSAAGLGTGMNNGAVAGVSNRVVTSHHIGVCSR